MTEFCWLIEAPGANYLGTREIAHHPEFFWTDDAAKALRFVSEDQADGVMMAVRRMEPALWAFAANLGEARPREHGWLAAQDMGSRVAAQVADDAPGNTPNPTSKGHHP